MTHYKAYTSSTLIVVNSTVVNSYTACTWRF
nr:MAG TPA: hypothetical protein [Caudoviricetes sp.]